MKIGYAVEDSVHEGFIEGLKRRWCQNAQLIKGAVRGSTKQAIRREVRQICIELQRRGAGLIVFLTDANNESWDEVRNREKAKVPAEYANFVIYAVAARNIECWLVLDRQYVARKMEIAESELAAEDPHGIILNALQKIPLLPQEVIADIVETMSFRRPLQQNNDAARSLKALYEEARDYAQRSGCSDFPNELAAD